MTKEERSRIRTYYEGTEYVSENILNNTPNLFSDIREIYNPIKNIVQGLTNSSIKDLEISSISDNMNLFVNEIWNANNMKSFKNKICKEVYIDGETYIEVIMLPDKKTINYILYKVDDIETLEEENVGLDWQLRINIWFLIFIVLVVVILIIIRRNIYVSNFISQLIRKGRIQKRKSQSKKKRRRFRF